VELPASVTTLADGDTTYYVVGTAHVSQRSVDDVKAVIAAVDPDVVCVELCKGRHDALTKDSAFRDLDVFKVVREGKTLYLLAHLALSSYQRKLGASLGVKPGAELLAAVHAANDRGTPVELVDRDIHITLRRTWKNLGLWKRSLLVWSLFVGWGKKGEPVTEEKIEELKEHKALSEMLSELGRAVPEVKTPLLDERDRYMVSKMRDAGAGKKTVVAVVGAAHVPGMTAQLHDPVDRAALEQIPPASWIWRIGKWAVPIAFLALLVLLWSRSDDPASFAHTMLAWIVPTSAGAALFTLLGGGSPLSALAALVVAPIARIYPLVRTGIVVGIVEAWRRKPTVVDCERLQIDAQSMRGFWRNKVTRILIVATLAGLGALLGFLVGVRQVAHYL
jgi:pheromone shutdown-related protein TraB